MSDTKMSVHPNLALLERLSNHFPHDIENMGDLITEDFVFHYCNSELPELDGDYKGLGGLQNLFQNLGKITKGTFKVLEGQLVHMGDELVVIKAKHLMTVENSSFEVDAVVVWRIVENHFVEAWDIPAVNTTRQVT